MPREYQQNVYLYLTENIGNRYLTARVGLHLFALAMSKHSCSINILLVFSYILIFSVVLTFQLLVSY